MLKWEEQVKIVHNINTKFSTDFGQKAVPLSATKTYKHCIRTTKFQQSTKEEFVFVVLMLHLKTDFSIEKLLIYMNDLSDDEIKHLKKQKRDFVNYKITFKKDINRVKSLTKDYKSVLQDFIDGNLSVIGAWYFLKDINPSKLTRINKSRYRKIIKFMSFFENIHQSIIYDTDQDTKEILQKILQSNADDISTVQKLDDF